MAQPQTLPVLQPRLLLGLQTHLQGNAQFISDEEILYPVGSVLALHNINQKRQKFVRLPDKGKNVTSIVVSPNKKLIAIVEIGEKPQITLYDSKTYKRKRQIIVSSDKGEATYATRISAATFSQDSRNIICVTAEPDWILYSYRCDKGKLESTARANNANGTGSVIEIAANPIDQNVLVLVGESLLRILQCTEFQWRQFGYSKSDQMILTTACWLSQDRILIGSKEGKFLYLEGGELRAIFCAQDLPVINLKFKEEAQPQTGSQTNILMDNSMPPQEEGQNYCIKSLINFTRGFAFAYLNGTVHLYEKETPHKYRKRNVFKIPDHTIVREYEKATNEVLTEVNCISINPAQDRLMVSCRESQLYSVRLWLQDINSSAEVAFSEFGYILHNGPIGSMAVCSWKPILLTAGQKDRTLKIWNYESCDLELGQKYQDDLYGVALHPTGLYCIVGFSDKLRYMTIMIDEFTINREFPIRVCKQCSFSQMGHFFAAANGNLIQVYSSITFDMFYTLKGHNGRITGMSWSADDTKLSTCGSEGAVYEWNVIESKRVAETIIKTCPFNDCVVTSDAKATLAVGKDGHIRELVNSVIYRDAILLNSPIDRLVLSRLDTMLFVTANNGILYSIRLPLMEKLETADFNIHSASVNNMLISANDKFVLTSSLDGSLCFWRVLNTDGRAIKIDKEFAVAREILISREVLEDKLNQIKDLHLRMHELETEFAYQMRQNDVVHNLRMKDVHQGYCNAIEDLKEKNEQLESDHQQELHNINMEINKMKQNHEQFVHKLEANYNEKLIYEYDKFMRLEEKMDKMRMEYEKQIYELRKAKVDMETSITNSFLEQLQEKDAQHDELLEQMKQKTDQHELIKQQIEDDADREIYEMKAAHEKELKKEQDANVKTRGETAMVRKKLVAAQKEIDDLKHSVYLLESDHTKFKSVIVDREKDIADLKKEITERDQTIQDKEKRIHELKRKNQELEKFKFILDFKIKELKSQIEPKERSIREQVEQMNEMVRELENLQKIILSLDLQLDELKEKLAASDNELKIEVAKNRRMKEALKCLRCDIHQASGYLQDIPMLKQTITKMFHKYNADKDFAAVQEEDKEAKSEFLRQREFLERTVTNLKQRVTRNQSNVGVDKYRLVEENALLLVETNSLRYNLKIEQRQNKKLQSVLGFSKKYVLPRIAQQKLHNAIATRDEIRAEYQDKIDDDEKAIAVLAGENRRLIKMVQEKEEGEGDEQSEDIEVEMANTRPREEEMKVDDDNDIESLS